MARSARCMNCGAAISRYAARCPACGAPQPQKRIGSTAGLLLTLLLLAATLLWAIFGQ